VKVLIRAPLHADREGHGVKLILRVAHHVAHDHSPEKSAHVIDVNGHLLAMGPAGSAQFSE
jgi:hypothetical protein